MEKKKIADIRIHLQEHVSHQLWHLSYFNQILSRGVDSATRAPDVPPETELMN